MSIHCYTSFSFGYLARARVLAATLKRFHPDWVLWAVITDVEPEGFRFPTGDDVFDEVLWARDLFADVGESWLFGHDVVEACTAVKGRALAHLLAQPGCSKVFYFDPDIAVFSSLAGLSEMLDEASIILTPHQLTPDTTPGAIRDNEITSLHFGTYNLGFLGVRNDPTAHSFTEWWAARLHDWCHDRLDIGVFVDQKWCNLIPAFFDDVGVVRDPGCNVASWNLSQRHVEIHPDGRITVNGSLLKFYHFTKMGAIGDTMTRRYAGDNTDVYEIWAWYRRAIARHRDPSISESDWYYARFDDGTPIARRMRQVYRTRADLRRAFPEPRRTGPDSFLEWYRRSGEG